MFFLLEKFFKGIQEMPENKDQIKYISLTEAAGVCDYSQEYLSLRARQRKLQAVKLGRNWFTTKEWLDDYIKKNSQFELMGDIQGAVEKEPKIGVSLPVIKIQPRESREKAKIYSTKQVKDHELRKLLDFWGGANTKIARRGKKRRPEIQLVSKKKFFVKKAYIQLRNSVRSFASNAYFIFKVPSLRTKAERTLRPAKGIYRKIRKTKEGFNLLASWLKQGWDWRAATAIIFLLFLIIFSTFGVGKNMTYGKITDYLNDVSKSLSGKLIAGFDKTIEIGGAMNSGLWAAAQNIPQQTVNSAGSFKQKFEEKAADFIFTYKAGLIVTNNAYKQAPDNIAFQWNKVEEVNKLLKRRADSAVRKSVIVLKLAPRAIVLNCADYALAIRNIMAKTVVAATISFDKAGLFSSQYGQKIGKKCMALGSEINLLVQNPLAVGEACKETTLGPMKLISEEIFAALDRGQAEIAGLVKRLKNQAQEFAYTYGVGLRVVQSAYQYTPLNLAEGWNGLEVKNDLAKKGLKNSIGYSRYLAVSGTMEILRGEREEAAIVVRLLSNRISALSDKGIAIMKNNILSISSGSSHGFKEFFASAFGQVQQIINQKFDFMFSFFEEASRKLAEKFVSGYELAVNYKNSLFSKQKKEEVNNAKLAEQTVKKGLIVVPSTSNDEEVKKKIQQNFSDQVKVDIQDEKSGIITPIFKDKEGDKYLYMMVPLSEQN